MPDRSDHEDIQVIVSRIHEGRINYIAAVSQSRKTAESGHAFAKMVQELCIALSGGLDDCPDTFIQKSIGEMQEIAQIAHYDAKVATEMFDASRQDFTEVWRDHKDESVIRRHP